MSLHDKLQQRAALKNPLRVGLIGAGKFGAMYLAQVPKTPGMHLAAIADLAPAKARAMNVAIFLDEVNEFNGPLMFIPGSHKVGVLDAEHDVTTTSYPLWTINHDTIRKLVERGGLVAPKGPAGSMILFHGCLVHASTANLSPWNRVSVYLSLCAVSNHIRRFKRPEYIAHRDFTPIACLPDDCLLKDYDVPLPWQDGTPTAALQPALAS